jgi:putative oxidoreductase
MLSIYPIALRTGKNKIMTISPAVRLRRPPKTTEPVMIDTRNAPFGLFLLRVALGVMFVAHAWLKVSVFTIPGFAGFLEQVGFPGALAWPVVLLEALGGVAIILGVYSRWVAAALIPVLIGALSVHAGNGGLFTAANGGWEYPAFLVVAAATLVLSGEGAFALRAARLPLIDRLVPQAA